MELLHSAAVRMAAAADALENGTGADIKQALQGAGDPTPAAEVMVRALGSETSIRALFQGSDAATSGCWTPRDLSHSVMCSLSASQLCSITTSRMRGLGARDCLHACKCRRLSSACPWTKRLRTRPNGLDRLLHTACSLRCRFTLTWRTCHISNIAYKRVSSADRPSADRPSQHEFMVWFTSAALEGTW